jgi:hypothetical protein
LEVDEWGIERKGEGVSKQKVGANFLSKKVQNERKEGGMKGPSGAGDQSI